MDKNTAFNLNLQLFAKNETTVSPALTQKAWAKQAWSMAKRDTTISNFVGKSDENIVQLDDTMKKEDGDQITFSLRMPLTGDGTEGDDVLEGKEEALEYHDFKVTINQLRKGTRLKGKMEEKKTSLKLRTDARTALKDWFAEKIESMYFDALNADPSPRRIVYPAGITAISSITASHTMSCAIIEKTKRKAKKRIVYTDDKGVTHIIPKIRPILVNGKKMYVMILTEEQMRDLRSDPVWVAAQSQANTRGEDNPLFSGSEGIWSGVVLFTNDNVEVKSVGNAGADVGHALFLGAQAACFAVGSEPEWEEDTFDYKNKVGFEMGQIFGIAKSVFDGEDLAVLHVYTASIEDN